MEADNRGRADLASSFKRRQRGQTGGNTKGLERREKKTQGVEETCYGKRGEERIGEERRREEKRGEQRRG